MPLPPAQLATLASLGEPKTTSGLARENGRPYETVYKAVRDLEKRGVITTHREGRALVATPRSLALSSLARSLIFDFPRQDWGRVFHGDRPMLLHVLDVTHDPELAAEMCGKSRSLVYHAIKTHAERGLLVGKAGRYSLNPRIQPLRELLGEMDRVGADHRLHGIDPEARRIWSLGPEILYATTQDEAPSGTQPAALSSFPAYGLDLITGDRAYRVVIKRELDAADAILQTLLVEPTSRINRSYAALLFEKAKPANLERKAMIYGLEKEALDLARFVMERAKIDGFLPWAEHERYRRQYEVSA